VFVDDMVDKAVICVVFVEVIHLMIAVNWKKLFICLFFEILHVECMKSFHCKNCSDSLEAANLCAVYMIIGRLRDWTMSP